MATIQEALQAGLKYHQSGALREAEHIYRQILQVEPNHSDALHLLGLIALAAGHHDAAIELIQKAIAVNDQQPAFHGNLGAAYAGQGRLEEAAASFRKALKLSPNYVDAHNNLGSALSHLGRHDEAIVSFRRAIALKPDFADAYNNLGKVLQGQGKLEEAAAEHRRALRAKHTHVDARYNLALVLGKLDRRQLAHEQYEQVLKLAPRHADAHNNLGNLWRDEGEFSQALACYERALECRPQFPLVRQNRGLALLRLGDFLRGWPDYESRWQCPGATPPQVASPRWDGSPLEGKTILLVAEQGLGDTIQFVRYAPLVQQRGGHVVLECQKPLARLLSATPGIDRIVPRGEPQGEHQVHASLLSLPGLLRTTLETIPWTGPYVFAEPGLVEQWHRELAEASSFRVGIAWHGNPQHIANVQRSIQLQQFAPLARVEGVRLFSLQKGPGAEQLAELRGAFEVSDLAARLDQGTDAFVDTAAVMKNLDLVITSDTSIAHLAGALGVPVWVALCKGADWRWLIDRDDCPWYPTMRLFRQAEIGRWEPVFERIASELAAKVSGE